MAITYNTSIVRNGLVLHLDAANKKSYPGSGTTWTDLSGNGNYGTLTNGPTFDSGNNGSIVFDGSNDYVSIQNGNYLNSNEFTISCWLYLNTISTTFTQYSFLEKNVYNTSGIQFAIGTGGSLNNRILGVRYSTSENIANVYNFTPGAQYVPFANWININLSFSYVAPNSFISLYINGSFLETSTNSSGTFVPNTKSLGIGIPGGGLGIYHNGKISNYLIYNRALTAAEIQQNFSAVRGRYGI